MVLEERAICYVIVYLLCQHVPNRSVFLLELLAGFFICLFDFLLKFKG